jgi:hypothetical protein
MGDVDLGKSALNFAATDLCSQQELGRQRGRATMNVKLFVAIGAAIAVLYGIAFLLIPGFAAAFYSDATPNAPTILAVRFYGVAMLSLGLVGWFVRETSDWTALRGLLLGLSIGNTVGVVVSIWGTVTGIMNAMGWSVVLIYLVLLAGYVYYLAAGRADAGI